MHIVNTLSHSPHRGPSFTPSGKGDIFTVTGRDLRSSGEVPIAAARPFWGRNGEVKPTRPGCCGEVKPLRRFSWLLSIVRQNLKVRTGVSRLKFTHSP
jgi:hypothetical protein